MLILRRKAGESIVIGSEIKVTVIDINEGSIRLAIDAPKRISVLRSELLQAADANRDAAHQTDESIPQSLFSFLPRGTRQTAALKKARPSAADAPAEAGEPAENGKTMEAAEAGEPASGGES